MWWPQITGGLWGRWRDRWERIKKKGNQIVKRPLTIFRQLMWRALPLSFLPAWAQPWSVIWWQALLIYDVKIFFSKSFFQVSLAAFSILMDYFSSIPVTKKNLVTRQTELLVSAMAFSVCSQVMFASIPNLHLHTSVCYSSNWIASPPPPLPLRGLILWLGFFNPSLGVQLLWFPDWSVCLYFGFSISYCSQCLTFHTLFRVSRSWPVCALNTSQNLSPCSVLASEVIFVTSGKMFGLKVQWCKLFLTNITSVLAFPLLDLPWRVVLL